MQPRFRRVIFLVIDGLRFDFAEWNEALDHLPAGTGLPAYLNRLTSFHRLLRDQPQHTLLLPCIADAPTTTTQRIKGFTTGSLPTFVDMGSNFDGASIAVSHEKKTAEKQFAKVSLPPSFIYSPDRLPPRKTTLWSSC